jgi:polyhydroxybutyrate depolymerase
VYNASSIVDDVEFTRQALQLIKKTVNVDPERVYAMGWSNGGFMTERLMCETPELWAGICADASAVGLLPGGREGQRLCDGSFGSSRVNYIHFHGTADPAVSWTGSFSANGTVVVPAALDDLARWLTRMDCTRRLHQTYNDGVSSSSNTAACCVELQAECAVTHLSLHLCVATCRLSRHSLTSPGLSAETVAR